MTHRFSRSLSYVLVGVLVAAVGTAQSTRSRALADDDDKDAARAAEKAARARRNSLEKLSTEEFAKHDRNLDGLLRGGEIPEGWLDRFDQNGDGSVSRSEFVDVNARPEKLRRLHPMRDARARADEALRTFDKDKSGAVERAEYPGKDDVFRRADRNRNGALEPAELRALAEDEIADIRKSMRNPDRYEFLVIFDVNKDNKVGPDEYDGASAVFRKYDTDGDGVVTYYELYPERMMAARAAAPKPEQETALGALDKDGDGKVTRAEFAGSDAAWRRLDRNGDGVVTVADSR